MGPLWGLRRLINKQEIRVLVLLSLALQVILVFLAIFRKRNANKLLSFLLWISYLAADYVATIALGYLLYKGNPELRQSINSDLTSFWAPFLLIHLGGPDTITSYSLEDNELWWRHFLGLVVQVSVASFVLLETYYGHRLWKATAAAFVIGVLKYGERTLCLRSASMDQLRDSIGMDSSTEIILRSPSYNIEFGDEMDQIVNACKTLRIVKGHATDQKLYSEGRTRLFFAELNHTQAFQLVEIELSFLYDIFHTKNIHVHSITGRLLRAFSFGTTIGTLLFFIFSSKEGYKEIDVNITYALLISAVGLEVTSILLLILSDWSIASLERFKLKKLARAVFAVVKFFLPNGKRYWSDSMNQYQFITFCLRDRPTKFKKVLEFLKMKNMWDSFWFLDHQNVPDEMKMFIYNQVKERAIRENVRRRYKQLNEFAQEFKEKVTQKMGQQCYYREIYNIMSKDFDKNVVLWHIATYICYHKEKSVYGYYNSLPRISKNISDYMLYLLLFKPSLMPAGSAKIRIKEIRDEVRGAKTVLHNEDPTITEEEACEKLLKEVTYTYSEVVPEELSLYRSVGLTRVLLNFNVETRWQIISAFWMEMLGYAAVNCGAYNHIKQLSRGGELLTHCWLLMVQMGIDY